MAGKGKEGPITPNGQNQPVSFPAGFEYKTMAAEFGKLLEPLAAKVETLTAKINGDALTAIKSSKDSILADAAKEGRVVTLSASALDAMTPDILREVVSQFPKGRLPVKTITKTLSADGKTPQMPTPSFQGSVDSVNDDIRSRFPQHFQESKVNRILN
jgi:hypothetical protein